MNPCVAAVILLLLGRNLGHAGCNVIVLLAAILMLMGAFVSMIDVGLYQNWILTDIGH